MYKNNSNSNTASGQNIPLPQEDQTFVTFIQKIFFPIIQVAVSTALNDNENIQALLNATKNATLPKDEIMTKDEVRQLLGVCDNTLYLYRKSGKLVPSFVGRKMYYKRSQVEALLK